jgi:hypothetical protein
LISILLLNFSVSGFNEDNQNISNYDYTKYSYAFILGFIDNLTYYNISLIELYGYNFTCKNIILLNYHSIDGFKIEIMNDDENYYVWNLNLEDFAESEYRGLITNKFICCLQIHKWDFE